MAMTEYQIRIMGFYRATKIDSIPITSGVLMVFKGRHIGDRACHIEKFCKSSAAENIKAAMQKELDSSIESDEKDDTILYFAYVEVDGIAAEQISSIINRRFKDNEPALALSNQASVPEGVTHIQLDGAVPIIWNNSRDFYMGMSASHKGE